MLTVPTLSGEHFDPGCQVNGNSSDSAGAECAIVCTRPVSYCTQYQSSEGQKPIKSMSCDRELLLLPGAAGSDGTTRRLSQGDLPLWLHEVSWAKRCVCVCRIVAEHCEINLCDFQHFQHFQHLKTTARKLFIKFLLQVYAITKLICRKKEIREEKNKDEYLLVCLCFDMACIQHSSSTT